MDTFLGPSQTPGRLPETAGAEKGLPRHLCQVMGLNQNYSSKVGTPYHIQIEDRGPVMDAASEQWVRRVNVIVYANYGEPNAMIIHGRDHDLGDVRTPEHNRFVEQKIQELALGARAIVEEREERLVQRVKALIRDYHRTKSEAAKQEFEQVNALYPFVFSRAFAALRQEKARPAAGREAVVAEAPPPAPVEVETVYPLDPALRERILEIERVAFEMAEDIKQLRLRGKADDVLVQTCGKLIARAREHVLRRDSAEFAARRLDMTRNSLVTAWRQVRALLLRA